MTRQKDKEKAVIIALHQEMALVRDGLKMYGMKKDGSKVFICKGKSYDSLWHDALKALEKKYC